MIETVELLADDAHLADAAAERFVTIVESTLRYRQVADVALAGGSTPRAMNALLTAPPRRRTVEWSRVRFFFGDERTVPPDDAESNYNMTRGEDDPAEAAAAYAAIMTRELGSRPRFDLLFLGMGPEGHTASIFPGTLASIDDSKLVVANWIEKLSTWRITLTPHVINDSAHVVITTGGASKADAVHEVMDGPHLPDLYPVQLVAPIDGQLHWLIDEAAAAKLVRRPVAGGRSSLA
jgi:6-phosphogluconolactonase